MEEIHSLSHTAEDKYNEDSSYKYNINGIQALGEKCSPSARFLAR
jgi:hypothetical protein